MNYTKFRCPYCEEFHEIPEGMIDLYKNYQLFAEGEIHCRVTGNLLVSDGYGHYKIEDSWTYPGPEFDYIRADDEDSIPIGSYVWVYGHGNSGSWHKLDNYDKKDIGEIYAIPKNENN